MSANPKVTETTEKKPAVKKVAAKLSAVAAAAAEINTKLTPDPLLDLAAGDKQLTKDLVEIIPSIQPDDDLSPATKKILTGLGWGKKVEKPIEKAPAKVVAGKGPASQPKAKAGAGTTKWGHRGGSISGAIDEALEKGLRDVEKIAKAAGCDNSRVVGHIKHLAADKGVKIAVDVEKGVVALK